MKQKITRHQEVIEFFSNHFDIPQEEILIRKSLARVSTIPSSFGFTSENYCIHSNKRRFFRPGYNKEGEPSPVEITNPDESNHEDIERFDEVIIKKPEWGKIPALWSSVKEIEDLLLRIRKTTFVRTKKQIYKEDGEASGEAQVIRVQSLDHFTRNPDEKSKDYVSQIDPKLGFVFRFEKKEPGGQWETFTDSK